LICASVWPCVLSAVLATEPSLSQTAADTVNAKSRKSPTGAMLRSTLVPGWGQWYADQRLRALAAFGGVSGLAGSAVYYNQMLVKSRTQAERDFYLNYRSQMVWWCGAVYLLNVLDAYVDAHLWHFETGPELSAIPFQPDGFVLRLSCTWRF